MGRVDEPEAPQILVPFVEMKFDGPTPEDGSPARELFSQILTLDNAAYVISAGRMQLPRRARCMILEAAGGRNLPPDGHRQAPVSRARRRS